MPVSMLAIAIIRKQYLTQYENLRNIFLKNIIDKTG